MLELSNLRHPGLLESILDPIFNTLFQQICIPPDFNKPHSVKNHNEILRCYDTMMKNYPGKLVNGLLNKARDGSGIFCEGFFIQFQFFLMESINWFLPFNWTPIERIDSVDREKQAEKQTHLLRI